MFNEIPKDAIWASNKVSFPTLYKLNTHGREQEWDIYVEFESGDPITEPMFVRKLPHGTKVNITTIYGLIGGKKQTAVVSIAKGKNINKANETNVLSQAILEAASTWKFQIDRRGYTQHKRSLGEFKVSPMLLKEYNKEHHKLPFPDVYVQPKLDGVRCLAHYDPSRKEIIFLSRTGTEFYHLNHIRRELLKIPELINSNGTIWLDGELYSAQINFEAIVGACRKQLDPTAEEKEQQNLLEYHVYDMFDLNDLTMPFRERIAFVCKWLSKLNSPYVVPVQTVLAANDAAVRAKHNEFVEEGYEGLVARSALGEYVFNKRTIEALKLKHFITEEFKIIGCKDGVGREAGLIIYELETKDHKPFMARPRGSLEARAALFKKCDKLIGKKITVRFTEYTADGIPRFPVALAIRDYE